MPKEILVGIKHKLRKKEKNETREKEMKKEEGWGSKGRTDRRSEGEIKRDLSYINPKSHVTLS